jgi:putative ABC transport system permease protein
LNEFVFRTVIGGARLIATQTPATLDPADATRIQITADGEPTSVKNAIQGDLNSLFFALGLLILAVGAVGIANITLVSVIERTPEIGLRRSLGASRGHIAAQFLTESALTGLIGGTIGSTLGTVTVVLTAYFREWTPVLPTWLPIGATLVGALIGLVSGLLPAREATNLHQWTHSAEERQVQLLETVSGTATPGCFRTCTAKDSG